MQRVGYRAWTEHMALQRGLEGWVRNRRDGTVEAVFAGPASVVEAMIEACRRGPPGAQVDALDAARRRARRRRLAPPRRDVLGAADGVSAFGLDFALVAALSREASIGLTRVGPNSGSNSRRSTMSTSAMRHRMAEIEQAGDAVARVGDAARHDAGEMRQVAIDIERDAVQADPALHPDADGGDLVLVAGTLVGPAHPDADAILAPLAGDVERRQGADDPFLQRGHEAADVGAAPLEVEHHIGDPLAGAVIGELSAAPAACTGKRAAIRSSGLALVPAV